MFGLADKDEDNMAALLKASTAKPMTPAQQREQRISFVYGNVGMSNPSVTRKMVEDVVDGVRPRPASAPGSRPSQVPKPIRWTYARRRSTSRTLRIR